MRIGIDARFYGSIGKGLGRYTEKLIEHLEKIDSENQYVVFLRRENFDDYIPSQKNFRKVLADYSWYGWREQLLFPFLLFRHRLDLVHFPHFNVPILYGKKFVVTVHDLILLRFPTVQNTTLGWVGYTFKYALYRIVIATAIRRAFSVLTVSTFTKEDIVAHYPLAAGKVFVTKEAADENCFFVNEEGVLRILDHFGLGGASHYGRIEKYFLYVGNAYPHKNLEAIIAVARVFPEYRFVFVGKEDFFSRRLQATVSGITNVSFIGFVSDHDLSVLYRNAAAYLFPSRYEGFGLPGLEAMQYGLPVIATNRGSLPEIYGDAALFFDPDEANDMERVMRRFLGFSDDERECLRKRGFAQGSMFRWSDMTEATLSVYQGALFRKK
jgi:glycosyltransferase involved in cell wall biosynthesis